mmetsp:Transcript_35187/g.92076  ORF Transcript_35187/g.92076 Transcript_35187/m.92076 type:complete len:581 (+) Transcript_35187:508-2250(+)
MQPSNSAPNKAGKFEIQRMNCPGRRCIALCSTRFSNRRLLGLRFDNLFGHRAGSFVHRRWRTIASPGHATDAAKRPCDRHSILRKVESPVRGAAVCGELPVFNVSHVVFVGTAAWDANREHRNAACYADFIWADRFEIDPSPCGPGTAEAGAVRAVKVLSSMNTVCRWIWGRTPLRCSAAATAAVPGLRKAGSAGHDSYRPEDPACCGSIGVVGLARVEHTVVGPCDESSRLDLNLAPRQSCVGVRWQPRTALAALVRVQHQRPASTKVHDSNIAVGVRTEHGATIRGHGQAVTVRPHMANGHACRQARCLGFTVKGIDELCRWGWGRLIGWHPQRGGDTLHDAAFERGVDTDGAAGVLAKATAPCGSTAADDSLVRLRHLFDERFDFGGREEVVLDNDDGGRRVKPPRRWVVPSDRPGPHRLLENKRIAADASGCVLVVVAPQLFRGLPQIAYASADTVVMVERATAAQPRRFFGIRFDAGAAEHVRVPHQIHIDGWCERTTPLGLAFGHHLQELAVPGNRAGQEGGIAVRLARDLPQELGLAGRPPDQVVDQCVICRSLDATRRGKLLLEPRARFVAR